MGKLGGDILEKMRDSVEEVKFHDKNKSEVKRIISENEWDEARLINEILLLWDYDRGSVNGYSNKEGLKEIIYQASNNKKCIERLKHRVPLHANRAAIFRQFLEQEGYDPKEVLEEAITENDEMERKVKNDLRRIEKNVEQRNEQFWA